MKKKIIVKDLVEENRKLQDTFKKRLNEGFFDYEIKQPAGRSDDYDDYMQR